MEPTTASLVLLASGAALVISLASVGFCALSRPSKLRRETDLLHDAVDAFERNELKRGADQVTLLQGVEAIHRQVADDLEAAEKKRRKAAGADAAAKRKNGQEEAPPIDYTDRAVLQALADRAGHE